MIRQIPNKELRPNRILHTIVEDNEKDYTYIILGRPGATGKTWLYNRLKLYEFTAFEISEHICNLVNYNDDKNHFVIDKINKQVIIVLNQPLELR